VRDPARREHEIVGLPGQARAINRVDRFGATVPALAGSAPLHVFLSNRANAPTLKAMLPQGEVVDFRTALSVLAPLPTAELERLFTETLDVASHRMDA